MEVYLLPGLVVGFLIYAGYLHYQNRTLKSETEELGELLSQSLVDSERTLEDQRASERELSIIKAKLDGVRESSFTPDNAVPKQVHVEKVLELSERLGSTESQLEDVTKKFEEARGKQISERVRLGQVGENFCAFHEGFPYSRKDTKALFQPVDLICFEDEEVIFIDVKTGGAQLSKKQRRIRDNIKAGRVRFEVHRLDENGYTIKEAK